jgi:hypothetical protein
MHLTPIATPYRRPGEPAETMPENWECPPPPVKECIEDPKKLPLDF